jgi:4-carboxymuconolactone decarboxylase
MTTTNSLAASAMALSSALIGASAAPAQAQGQLSPYAGVTAPTAPADIEAARPNPQAPGFRIPLPTLEEMDPEMRAAFEGNAKPLHTPVGPRAPLLITPEIGKGWGALTSAVAKVTIPQDSYEMAILMVAVEWRSGFEWWVHAPLAVKAGIPADAVEAIRSGKTPTFTEPRQQATYDFLHELLSNRRVSDATYERLRAILGSKGLVELTTTAGTYAALAMTLVAHGVPLREGVENPFPDGK